VTIAGRALRLIAGGALAWGVIGAVASPEISTAAKAVALAIAAATMWQPRAGLTVLVLAAPGEKTQSFEGRVDGTLAFPPRGAKGFGYDPIFVPDGGTLTFGEMEPDEKHAISHRAKAFAKFTGAMLLP
jgi:XTP/dITP diphosphohydrolase